MLSSPVRSRKAYHGLDHSLETASGGMYNHPLVVTCLNITGPGYVGVRVYGLSKRAQVVLTQYWRRTFADTERYFYVMHPGWVDTVAVGRSMPRFRETLKSVLRSDPQGGRHHRVPGGEAAGAIF